MKKVAIVILNWNGKLLLEQFIPSVMAYSDNHIADIIVADNASTDDSVEFLNREYPQIRIISLARNYGYAGGYNRVLKQINAEYFVLLNSDVEVTEGWLNPLVTYLENNESVAAAQPKIKSFTNKILFEYAGAAGGYIDKLGYPFCRGRMFGTIEEDERQYDSVTDIFWASGACLFIRSKDFFEVGGFDDFFFAHMEEIDLCWRLNLIDRKIACIPQSVVYHVGGATLDAESPRKTYLNFRNNLLMLYKNLSDQSLSKVIRWRFFLDNLAALHFLIKGKAENARAVWRARKEFKNIRARYTKERISIQKSSVGTDIPVVYYGSILMAYYLRRVKHFSCLIFFKK